ncbi:TPA: hypothetical protein L4V00_001801 [Pseudomonas aeruginosa]|nr:hypothetical protein [Pseudomonas aeruginosa]HBO4704388.1 hypothetical protein [Pseudomonas aeruginosa]
MLDPKRSKNFEHALATARLSGALPSAKLLELGEQYRQGAITAAEMVSAMKKHYRTR